MAIATSTLITIAAIAVATGVSTYATVASANAQEESANYNAQVAENDSVAARQQSLEEANRKRDQNRRFIASQRTAFAKNGSLSGSALDVMYDSAVQGELDALSLEYTGNVAANRAKNQAGLFRMEAANARTAGTLGAAGTLLGGAAQGYGAYAASRPKIGK